MFRSERLITIGGAVLILLIAQLLNSAMEISSFEKSYRQAIVSNYSILGQAVRQQLENDLANGKPLYLNSRVEEYGRKLKNQDPHILDIMLTGENQTIFYHSREALEGRVISDQELFPPPTPYAVQLKNPQEISTTELRDKYYLGFPVRSPDGQAAGKFYFSFDKRVIRSRINQVIRTHMRLFLVIITGTIFLMILGLLANDFFLLKSGKGDWWRRRIISIIILTAVVASQLLFTFQNQNYFRQAYRQVFLNNLNTLANDIQTDMNDILRHGVELDELTGGNRYLTQRLSGAKEASRILIANPKGKILYGSGREREKPHKAVPGFTGEKIRMEGNSSRLIEPLEHQDGTKAGILMVEINQGAINRNLRDMFYDTLTIILVSFIVSLELLRLLTLYIGRGKELTPQESKKINLNRIRLTAFLFFFGALIPLSYLPIFISKIHEANPVSFFGMETKTILSLPISSYMIGITLFIPLVGILSHRLPVRRIALISGSLFIGGTLWTAFSASVPELILARFIAGLGYGGGIINSTTMILQATEAGNRSQGFGNWSAGFAAASICAISIGGVIVYRLGYTTAFLMASGFGLLTMLFIQFMDRPSQESAAQEGSPASSSGDEQTGPPPTTLKDFLVVFKNRSLAANLFFTSVPFQLAYVGLFQYIFPLYMNDIGIVPSNIGRILMIYGLISLLTPLISAFSDRTRRIRPFIVFGNLVMGGFLIAFFIHSSFLALLATVFFMGLGSTIVDAVNETYITGTQEAESMGETKLLSLYLTYEKIISIIVPVTAGVLIASFDYMKTIGIIGVFTVAGTLIFALVSQSNPHKKPEEGVQP